MNIDVLTFRTLIVQLTYREALISAFYQVKRTISTVQCTSMATMNIPYRLYKIVLIEHVNMD